MAACESKSPQDCKTQSECMALSKDGGAKYTFDENSKVKCMLVPITSAIAKDCTVQNESTLPKVVGGDDKTKEDTKAATQK